jgi:alkanesulfonate monooxygenase SsuD/methylene tetrahydromethanopterin reductase-like flavin-dependent oxidoreductase (luciferase family)
MLMNAKSLRYGLYLPPFGPLGDPVALIELAVRAEAAGWDGVFLWDHAVSDHPPITDPWTTLAAMAQATERILLGPMVTPLARRRPWVVARHASAVSQISRGRLILGTGLGSDESGDFSRFGDPTAPSVRAAMLDEGLDIVRAVWTGAAYLHHGKYYQVRLPAGTPEPYPIPVWMASSTGHPRVLRRAARCDGIFPNPDDHLPTPEEIAETLAGMQLAGLPDGRSLEVAVRGNASAGWDEPNNVDLTGLAEAGVTWWMESLIHFDPLELTMHVVDTGPPRI